MVQFHEMNTVLFALWFFLPAGVANAAPILAARLPYLSRWRAPLDGHATYRSKRVFGPHKTWRGLVFGIIAAVATVYIQQLLTQRNQLPFLETKPADYLFYSPLLLGFLFGFGALAGDAIESFFKRQSKIAPGEVWLPFDQIDYILGGCLAIAVFVRLDLGEYLAVLVTWFTLHVVFSYLGYLLNLKSKPI